MRKNFGKGKRDFDFFLKRTRYFLDLVGSPDKDMKYVHVTGTAGKGTVSTMMEEVLSASGKKVGMYTSPFVTTPIDKIKANGKYISPASLVRLTEYLKPFMKKAESGPYGAPSAFELFFALALLYFKEEKCQWAVLEVGLGGRYDATNVIKKPEAALITTIDYDHTEILGKTLREIAYDKAGIIKKNCHFFTAEQRPALLKLFKKICKEQDASFEAIGKQKDHTQYNEALVARAAEFLGIKEKDIKKGIEHTRMPCRFEIVQKDPLVILDGAHNRAKIRSTIATLKNYSYKKLFVILALAETNRDHQAVLSELVPKADCVIATQMRGTNRRSVYAGKILAEMKRYSTKKNSLEMIEDPYEALSKTLKKAGKNDLVLVTGSFFLAGELRKKWYSEEWVLTHRKSFN